MKMTEKRYTLRKVSDGETPVCAFFNSAKGCHNGDKCKFLHVSSKNSKPKNDKSPMKKAQSSESPSKSSTKKKVKAKTPPPKMTTPIKSPEESSSVVSSESESEHDENQSPPPSKPKQTTKKRTANNNDQPDKRKTKVKKTERKSDIKPNESPFASTAKTVQAKDDSPFAIPVTSKTVQAKDDSPFAIPVSNSSSSGSNSKQVKKGAAAERSASKAKKAKTNKKQDTPKAQQPAFRAMIANFPIAAFVPPEEEKNDKDDEENETEENAESSSDSEGTDEEEEEKVVPGSTILPTHHPKGIVWQDLMKKCREHARYAMQLNFENAKEKDSEKWFKAEPYGPKFEANPQVIAIDCEMCGAKDPKTGERDLSALCRFSVVDVTNGTENAETLIDTLVKPDGVVYDDRAWVNGIKKHTLDNVQFTLEHAQQFMKALCSEETIIAGHSVINDLRSLKMEHYCVLDSSYLFEVEGREHGHAALRDLAPQVLGKDMPEIHCSVNDAIVAMECIEAFRDKKGKVDPIKPSKKPLPPFLRRKGRQRKNGHQNSRRQSRSRDRGSGKNSDNNDGQTLLIHRIPKIVKQEHLVQLFSDTSKMTPKSVGKIVFGGNKTGKSFVRFDSQEDASKAYDALTGKASKDAAGFSQKSITLKNGDYLRVRGNTKHSS